MSCPVTPEPNKLSVESEEVRKSPGGLYLNYVLGSASRTSPRTESKSLPCSPLTRVDITEKLERAEARREELLKLRKENIDQKLALAQERKDELLKEKAEKAKEVLSCKMKVMEENKKQVIEKTVEGVKAHLSDVEQKIKELEVSTEAEKIAMKLAMDADIMKVDGNRKDHFEKRMKDIQSHVEYVNSVNRNQELKKMAYLANLEESLEGAAKRKEDAVAKVVAAAKENEAKVEEARVRREKEEKAVQLKAKEVLSERIEKVVENQVHQVEVMRTKMEERNRKAETVRQNKMKILQQKDENVMPESA